MTKGIRNINVLFKKKNRKNTGGAFAPPPKCYTYGHSPENMNHQQYFCQNLNLPKMMLPRETNFKHAPSYVRLRTLSGQS